MKREERFNWFTMFFDGMRNMTRLGKILWIVVIIKLIIMFAILKPVFFANFLADKGSSEKQKAEYVINQLVDRGK